MKVLNKFSVILFTLCLILLSISLPAVFISNSKTYYKNQFIKCNSYPDENEYLYVRYIGGDRNKTAKFTSAQVDDIIEHITDFLSDKKDSFALQMDGVVLNGIIRDDINIFSDESVEHMQDVKLLFLNIKYITAVIFILFVLLGIYIVFNRRKTKEYIFNYSLYSILGLITVIILFLLFVIIKSGISNFSFDTFFSTLWEYMHYLFFPFSPDKFMGSFFNDTLTMILNIDFFMNTVRTIVSILCSSVSIWLITSFIIQKKFSKK